MTTTASSYAENHRKDWTQPAVHLAGGLLAGLSWFSALCFGLYIFAWYGGALHTGAMGRWNDKLPELYTAQTPLATLGIGLHFAAGAVILLFGPLQLLGGVRRRAPALHRWVGRAYIGCALLAGVGGLAFLAMHGAIGGPIMDVGFGLYGALMLLAASETLRHAMARQIEHHRAWAIRLFALAIGSWLYRLEYGFWLVFTDGSGHTDGFRGWFDNLMAFAFYLPNLGFAELYLAGRHRTGLGLRLATTGALLLAAAFVGIGTYFFLRFQWGPAIFPQLALAAHGPALAVSVFSS